MSEQGGRYQRSASGLVGAMLVLVVAVVGFMVFRGVFSRDVDNSNRASVDYLASVEQLQDGGIEVVYPESLPSGWVATGVDVRPVERPGALPDVGLDLAADGDRYVGVKLADADVDDLLEEYVDVDPEEGEPLTGADGVATDWAGWSDAGGDYAYTAAYGDRTLLVFGSVPADDLAGLVARLTDALLPGVTPPTPPASVTSPSASPSPSS